MYATVMQLHHCVAATGCNTDSTCQENLPLLLDLFYDTSANYFFVNNMLKFVICGNAYSAIEFLFPAFVACLLACLLACFLHTWAWLCSFLLACLASFLPSFLHTWAWLCSKVWFVPLLHAVLDTHRTGHMNLPNCC